MVELRVITETGLIPIPKEGSTSTKSILASNESLFCSKLIYANFLKNKTPIVCLILSSG